MPWAFLTLGMGPLRLVDARNTFGSGQFLLAHLIAFLCQCLVEELRFLFLVVSAEVKHILIDLFNLANELLKSLAHDWLELTTLLEDAHRPVDLGYLLDPFLILMLRFCLFTYIILRTVALVLGAMQGVRLLENTNSA